ncbi:MAG: DUF4290 domain-containing protein [Chitinophagales bacterium]|nr:DUF4290 domain-containing protein [Chitinophagales bacterium]HMV16011.1 DUF4290 domain-containing protein [Chitinophagales bacterium]HMW11775.1 DUF4290 domain-containing protein [Chitinophagales bacterium]HMX59350.1 DUF4290 domain-containing protein [Chitinophagales bacterium]HMY23440.1 DUF4290 domain-containing protein [Chitinophagales bacterium]
MNYNTSRNDIEMREYGRHVQKMVDYAVSLQDRKERQAVAENIIQLMSILNPQLRNTADYKHKLWDHIFIISDFKLDVDSPYPIPTAATARIKPSFLPYPQKRIKLKHYGKNVEALVKKAIDMEDEDKKEIFTEIIGNFMKLAYKNWSNEEVSNDLIKEDMKTLSGGELIISEDMNIESMTRNQQKQRSFSKNNNKNRNNNNRNNNNRNNNNRNNNNRNNFQNNNNRNRYK